MSIKKIGKNLTKNMSLLLSGFLLSTASFALPPAFTANYEVKHNNIKLGDMQASLQFNGQQYIYKKDSKASGFASLLTKLKINENVQGRVEGNTLIPNSYTYIQKRRGDEKRTQYRFLSATKVSGVFKGDQATFDVPKGSLDRASIELTLAEQLRNNQHQLSYFLVEKDGVEPYQFVIQGIENINVAGKVYPSTRVAVKRDTNDRQTIYWMAKDLSYLPVKVYHNEKGSVLTTQLTSINIQ